MNKVRAVILAGGKGERMGEISKAIPKPMLKIGNKPILEHQIDLLKKYNIRDVIILTNHLSEIIENYFKDGRDFGINIRYFKEDEPLSTAGALKEIENELNDDFLVLYGDVMVNLDLDKFIDFHRNKNSKCTLVLHPNDHPWESDLVEINSNQKIIAFHAKSHDENKYFRNLTNACLYLMSPRILNYIERSKKSDFGRDIFPNIYQKEDFYGYNTAEYLKDIGRSEWLEKVEKDYQSGKIKRLNKNNKRKAIFMDRDGVINKEVGLIYKLDDFNFLDKVSQAIKKINDSEFLAVVISNQPVVAKGLCSLDQLEEINKKMETLLGRQGAKLDGIYYCPHHPDKGYPGERKEYKIDCECRKPKIGLVKQAEKDFNIDLNKSYFIGDSYRDILCAKNTGIISIGVKTGKGCKDGEEKPDYLFDDLDRAVEYIISARQ